MDNNIRLPRNIKVSAEAEYEIDIDGLDPKYVDIEGFIRDEAIRIFKDDINNDQLNFNISSSFITNDYEAVIEAKNGDIITIQFASDTEHVEGCDSSIECSVYPVVGKEYTATYDYNEDDKQYENIKDSINDILSFIYRNSEWFNARYYTILPITIAQFLYMKGE